MNICHQQNFMNNYPDQYSNTKVTTGARCWGQQAVGGTFILSHCDSKRGTRQDGTAGHHPHIIHTLVF